eukprot:8353395-Karenia_brevis.AAC.1
MSLSVGCNACGRSDCWTTNAFNRQRVVGADAQMGDNVPHMMQTSIAIYANNVLQPNGPRLEPNWWTACRSLVIEVDGRSYIP